MTKEKMAGLLVNGSVRAAGVTFYTRKGQTVVRTAHSQQPRSNSRGQFVARQRMKHTTALWGALKVAAPMFGDGKNNYGRFCKLASALPVVFTPRQGVNAGATLLLPGMPVSDGTLPTVRQRLGEAGGSAALLTDVKVSALGRNEGLRLYMLQQTIEGGTPRVRVYSAEVPRTGAGNIGGITYQATRLADGSLALTGNAFADEDKGWAVVRVDGERCSSQTAVTGCRQWEAFATEEALKASAETYGGLTE